MWIIRLLGLKMGLRDGLGAYFWSSKFDLDFFNAILLYFVVCDCFGLDFGGGRHQKSLIFIKKVVIFEAFAVSTCDIIFVVF